MSPDLDYLEGFRQLCCCQIDYEGQDDQGYCPVNE